ncbi:MAG: sigma-54-dependent Fis family transcriptional regulator [Gemmatimonadetes bacterium]|jgi:two-component system, NtrC family, response regulator AtoC|nr:sigma-54-dependent Fis family transcriptional regulator [Gemmatimonadota bacterium]MBT7862532.1 sigma-54-dependent Fis family transcriptional regulator [Gemmatimonadota bacterium]
MSERILVVDDEVDLAASCTRLLDSRGYGTGVAASAEEALEILSTEDFQLVLTDLKMPGMGGMELLRKVREASPEIQVLMMTAYSTVEDAVEAMRLGAVDFVPKPFTPDHLLIVIEKALEKRTLRRENQSLKDQLSRHYSFDNIIGKSSAMTQIFESIKKIAETDISVLITGASGTGKELIARSIHANSKRSSGPFVPINCGALPENLVESEIFGFEKGAFTSAARPKPGLLEEAHGGTFFLDEIGELPPSLQVKFLRVLEDGRFRRLGSNQEREVNVRLVCATNRNLEQVVDEGEFREDLYYRINTFPIHLPPLRERRDDIALLADHYLHVYSQKNGMNLATISPEAMDLLMGSEWRGNVRELQNVIERALVLASDDVVQPEDLPPSVKKSEGTSAGDHPEFYLDLPFKDAKEHLIEDFEKRYIVEVLKSFKGNISRSAEHSGIDRRSLHRLLSKYHIDAHQVAAEEDD